MIARQSLFAICATALALLAACDWRDGSPTAPRAPDPGAQVTALHVSGNRSLQNFGETSQLTARADFYGGGSLDVTQSARWQVSLDPAVSLRSPGLVVAEHWGVSLVKASYGQPEVSSEVEVRFAPAGAFLLRGSIVTPSGSPLAGAQIEVESAAGVFASESDDTGAYILPARGQAVLRLEAAGYDEITRQLDVEHDSNLDLHPNPRNGDDLNGIYLVTILAAATCDLPSAAMARTFEAIVFEQGTEVVVEAQGYEFVAWGGGTGFTGTREGNVVTFEIRDTYDDGFNLIERIDGIGDLYFSGTASGTIRGRDVDAIFDGTLQVAGRACTSSQHGLSLTWMSH